MAQDSINIVQLFKFSFNQYKKYASFVFGAMLTFFVLAILPQVYFVGQIPDDPNTQMRFLSFLLTLIQLFLSLGFIKIMLRLVQDKHVEVTDMFNNFRPFLSYFVASFLYGIAVALGLLLLIVPGIFVAIRFQFFPYFILENNDNFINALQKSYYLSQNLTLELLLLGIIVIVMNVAGILFFGVGVLFTYPLTTMAIAIVYRSLIEEGQTIPSNSYRI